MLAQDVACMNLQLYVKFLNQRDCREILILFVLTHNGALCTVYVPRLYWALSAADIEWLQGHEGCMASNISYSVHFAITPVLAFKHLLDPSIFMQNLPLMIMFNTILMIPNTGLWWTKHASSIIKRHHKRTHNLQVAKQILAPLNSFEAQPMPYIFYSTIP